MDTKIQQITDLISPEIQALGFILWGCELKTTDRGSLLRIYIDADNGVQIDDCAKVSRQISALLDVGDTIAGKYQLEVSSPGVERVLFTTEHYQRYIGEQIKVQLLEPMANSRKHKGILTVVNENEIILNVHGENYTIPFHLIKKANLLLI